ncbi:hypothetical protein [Bacillus paramycoides]|uniref:hypothetical protein n=1 Tax=Bacillus paramycoides TaxID=2026194 RepID=UPI0038211A17
MKLTLFTISNEQIKESLNKLQTKVDSFETVKEVQDKIISMKDNQIAFLNTSIGNIWIPVSIAAGFMVLLFSYIAYLNRKANKKMTQAEEKIKQAESIITQAQSVSKNAQEKINELEEKQKELNDLTNSTIINQQISLILNNVKIKLDLIEQSMKLIRENLSYKHLTFSLTEEEKMSYFFSKHIDLEEEFINLSFEFNTDIINGEEIFPHEREKIKTFNIKCDDLFKEYSDFKEELKENYSL